MELPFWATKLTARLFRVDPRFKLKLRSSWHFRRRLKTFRPFFSLYKIEEMQSQSTTICKRKHQDAEKHPDRKANRFRQEAEKLISVSAKNLTQVNVDEDSTSFMAYTWGEAERGQLGHGDEM